MKDWAFGGCPPQIPNTIKLLNKYIAKKKTVDLKDIVERALKLKKQLK